MSKALDVASDMIGRRLDQIRREVFKREFRETMRLTFIARDPNHPESDMFVSEDDIEGVIDLLRRTVDRASDRNPQGGDANAAPGRSPESAAGTARPEQGQSASPEPREPVALIRDAAEALHRLEDRRLAASIRSDQAWRDEARCWLDAILAAAPQGIPQGVEARNAARFRWLSEHFLGADFDWGADSESGTAGTPVLLIQIGSALVYGDLGLTVDEAMGAAISQGEQKS
jgi:hypothetical protein